MSIEQLPAHASDEQQTERFDMRTYMQLQTDILRATHPEWDDPSGNEVVKHAKEIEDFAIVVRALVEAHPEILDAYRADPQVTVAQVLQKIQST